MVVCNRYISLRIITFELQFFLCFFINLQCIFILPYYDRFKPDCFCFQLCFDNTQYDQPPNERRKKMDAEQGSISAVIIIVIIFGIIEQEEEEKKNTTNETADKGFSHFIK